MPDPSFFTLLFITIAIFAWATHIKVKNDRLQAALSKAIATPPPAPPQPSQELSDFLNDTKTGYSFVRVAPSDVIIRSPRG